MEIEKKSFVPKCRLTKTFMFIIIIIMTSIFFLAELIIGYLTHSNAIIADSFHMLSDLIALIIGLIAVRFTKRGSSKRNTFGWVRAEVLGSFFNSVFLLALCFTIVISAINRFIKPEPLEHVELMLAVGGAGVLLNLVSLILIWLQGLCEDRRNESKTIKDYANNLTNLDSKIEQLNIEYTPSTVNGAVSSNDKQKKDKKKKKKTVNLNLRAVLLNALGDSLGAVAVIICGCLAKFAPPINDATATWKLYIDPSLSLFISIIIIVGVIPLLKKASLLLLQTVPHGLNYPSLKEAIKSINGIKDVHHFHIWSLNTEKFIASAHIRVNDKKDPEDDWKIVNDVKNLLHKNKIHSTTIQLEHDTASLDSCNTECCEEIERKCCNNINQNGDVPNGIHETNQIQTQIRQTKEKPEEFDLFCRV